MGYDERRYCVSAVNTLQIQRWSHTLLHLVSIINIIMVNHTVRAIIASSQARPARKSTKQVCDPDARSGVFATLARHADACLTSPYRGHCPVRDVYTQKRLHRTGQALTHQRTIRLYPTACPVQQRLPQLGCIGFRR
jgi:hypothetical protein